MSEQETDQFAQQVAELLRAKLALQPQIMAAPAPAAQLGATPLPSGVGFRISIPLPDGREVSGFLMFGSELAGNAQSLQLAAAQVAATWPVSAYYPRRDNSYSNSYNRGPRRGGGRGWY